MPDTLAVVDHTHLCDIEADLRGPTCKQCRHWHALPRSRTPEGGIDLAQPQQGECREQLRSLPIQGPSGPGVAPYYQHTPEGWEACGRFEERNSLPPV